MIPSLLTDSVTYDLERAVHYALLWGLEGVELRSVGGVHDRVPHVNEQKLKMRLMESDLPVVAVDPGIFVGSAADRVAWLNELVALEETLDFCRRIGCERVVVSSFLGDGEASADLVAEALTKAGRKAEKAGVRLCVVNEGGYVAETGGALAELLDDVDCDSVGAAWSPAEAVMAGEAPSDGLHALAHRIDLVRCRNIGRGGNGWEPRPIDNGEIDWAAHLEALAQVGFDGPLCLDVDVEPIAKEGLRGATALIRALRSIPREARKQKA